MEPLHQAHVGGDAGVAFERGLGAAVGADQAHVEVAVVTRPLRLAVPRLRAPFLRQVEQRIPVDVRHPPEQQLRGAFEAEDLHLVRPEAADADLGRPDRLVGHHRFDLGDLVGPGMDRPEVPVEWEAVDGDHVDRVQRAVAAHLLHPRRVDRRHAAQHPRHLRVDRGNRPAGADHRVGIDRPIGIEIGVPVRLVVGFVPDHRRFDHGRTPFAG